MRIVSPGLAAVIGIAVGASNLIWGSPWWALLSGAHIFAVSWAMLQALEFQARVIIALAKVLYRKHFRAGLLLVGVLIGVNVVAAVAFVIGLASAELLGLSDRFSMEEHMSGVVALANMVTWAPLITVFLLGCSLITKVGATTMVPKQIV